MLRRGTPQVRGILVIVPAHLQLRRDEDPREHPSAVLPPLSLGEPVSGADSSQERQMAGKPHNVETGHMQVKQAWTVSRRGTWFAGRTRLAAFREPAESRGVRGVEFTFIFLILFLFFVLFFVFFLFQYGFFLRARTARQVLLGWHAAVFCRVPGTNEF